MAKSKWENFAGQDMSFLSQYPVPKNLRDFSVKLCDDQTKRFQIMKFDWKLKLHWLTGRINEVWGKCNTASRITQSYTFFLLNFDWKKTIEAQDRLLKTILRFLLFHMLGNIPIIRAVRKCQKLSFPELFFSPNWTNLPFLCVENWKTWKNSVVASKFPTVTTNFRGFAQPMNKPAYETVIPDICHERHEYIRVNFFWPV